jgi:hypothetical protein
VEIANGVTVHMTRRGIAAVLPPDAEDDDAETDEADEVDEADEAPVTEDEEVVTSAVGDVSAGEKPR